MRRLREPARLVMVAEAPGIGLLSLSGRRRSNRADAFRGRQSCGAGALRKELRPPSQQLARVP